MGTFSVYNESTAKDPSILNEFAAAAYRVGHSQVKGFLTYTTRQWSPDVSILWNVFGILAFYRRLYTVDDQIDTSFALSDYFFNASLLAQPGFIDNAMRGLTKQMPNQINPSYTKELTFRLFKYYQMLLIGTSTVILRSWQKKRGSKPFGLDLVALNIQRGREHGIPDYNTMRVKCGLPKANDFDDLAGEINSTVILTKDRKTVLRIKSGPAPLIYSPLFVTL